MTFDPGRLHPTLLDGVPLGARWRTLTELPAGGKVETDDVGVRLAMYRRLIESTNPRGALGQHDELHPLWGFAHQLVWQQRSGRLGGAGGVGGRGDAIDPASWWGRCNYALSVVPYWVAMEDGLVPRLEFARPGQMYLMATASWRDALGMMVAYVKDADLEPLRMEVWKAHLHGLDAAMREHFEKHVALPLEERHFATGWARMVDLFAAAGLRTDLERLAHDGGALPSRMLRAEDDLADLPKPERAMARLVAGLGARAPWRWAVEARMWQRMMRERAERLDAERLLAALFGKGDDVWSTRTRALKAAFAKGPPRRTSKGDRV